jgi:branched-chain amino acid transport system ATP-binding protein
MLELKDIHTYYGDSYILQGVSLKVNEGSVVALLGRNGMGKTTTIRSIIGLAPPRRGEIIFKGKNVAGLPPYAIARRGIGLVPQGREIFPSLSVRGNLTMAARSKGADKGWTLDNIYTRFPILKARAETSGTLLSGGEQQMLCIARALMTNPDSLLLDEPSEGLAPIVVQEVGRIIGEIKKSSLSILLVEQNVSMALALADYAYIISKGQIVYESAPDILKANEEIKLKFLGITT